MQTDDKIEELANEIVFTDYELFIPTNFSDGVLVKDWFSHIKMKLSKRTDKSAKFVFFVLNNRRKIAFELKKQEMLKGRNKNELSWNVYLQEVNPSIFNKG